MRPVPVFCAVVAALPLALTSSTSLARSEEQHVSLTSVRTPEHCRSVGPFSCPSDLHALPLSGPALRGYHDPNSGLVIRIRHLYVGRVVLDEGCSSNLPQYQAYIDLTMRNGQSRPVIFDWIGLALYDQHGVRYNAFGWGGAYPSHAAPIAPRTIRRALIPYTLRSRPTRLTVEWSLVTRSGSHPPVRIAMFRIKQTGVKVCAGASKTGRPGETG